MLSVDGMIRSENWMFANGYPGEERVSHHSGSSPNRLTISMVDAAIFNHVKSVKREALTLEEYYEGVEV